MLSCERQSLCARMSWLEGAAVYVRVGSPSTLSPPPHRIPDCPITDVGRSHLLGSLAALRLGGRCVRCGLHPYPVSSRGISGVSTGRISLSRISLPKLGNSSGGLVSNRELSLICRCIAESKGVFLVREPLPCQPSPRGRCQGTSTVFRRTEKSWSTPQVLSTSSTLHKNLA